MAEIWRLESDMMFLILLALSLFGLSSSDGYSCNCDCGPNAGGGRCTLLLPSIEYLKSGGTCQAIELGKRTQECVKDQHLEDATTCWSMPQTACMCREPAGHYNLMCECDGNRGIFCGSEQNNCVCTVLVADKNVAIAIGIGVGSTVVGIFVLTFIITIIYFIRKAQKAKDPWYQFDKQFKQFMAKKQKEKASGDTRPPRKESQDMNHL
ncbi:uncharacterized protein [Amphiura filiformis]|uniref:uncharacterized protein isoform X2 n=1 Tax=Amphiura filiformis TaxID=82378 RepID=UPI003B212284